jgi:hypothetical protein
VRREGYGGGATAPFLDLWLLGKQVRYAYPAIWRHSAREGQCELELGCERGAQDDPLSSYNRGAEEKL